MKKLSCCGSLEEDTRRMRLICKKHSVFQGFCPARGEGSESLRERIPVPCTLCWEMRVTPLTGPLWALIHLPPNSTEQEITGAGTTAGQVPVCPWLMAGLEIRGVFLPPDEPLIRLEVSFTAAALSFRHPPSPARPANSNGATERILTQRGAAWSWTPQEGSVSASLQQTRNRWTVDEAVPG